MASSSTASSRCASFLNTVHAMHPPSVGRTRKEHGELDTFVVGRPLLIMSRRPVSARARSSSPKAARKTTTGNPSSTYQRRTTDLRPRSDLDQKTRECETRPIRANDSVPLFFASFLLTYAFIHARAHTHRTSSRPRAMNSRTTTSSENC